MTEAGGRRIKRALFVDATSVRFLSHDEIERLERLTLLKDYLEDKVDAIEQWNGTLGAAASGEPPPADESRHVPRVCRELPEGPSAHPPRHDLHGAATAAHGRRHSARTVLLHRHDDVGRLRGHPVRPVRSPDRGAAGVRAARVPAPVGLRHAADGQRRASQAAGAARGVACGGGRSAAAACRAAPALSAPRTPTRAARAPSTHPRSAATTDSCS